ncbi:glycosyltransferase [Methylocaldum sp.]|uniref:glycosyltransferase n=1 Tax=Methylocaldum sp. TaxID=1969727 RepID=UPI002D5BF605|nr:glycosyltransferase [Methylocaldum sp.]HYE37787.1 glycosyltransferase [Methylocaldum sp.]
MKIGIELRNITLGEAGGITQLLKGVLDQLFSMHPEEEFFVFCTIFNRGLLEPNRNNVKFITVPAANYWEAVDRILDEEKIQVLFRSYPAEDTFVFPLEKQVFLIPDIQHERYPEFFDPNILRSRRECFPRAVYGAGAIATISDFAKQTICDFYGDNIQDIFVVKPALQKQHRVDAAWDLTDAERQLIPDRQYFIYPANLWKHKNHPRVLKAFDLYLRKSGRKDVRFLFTGHPSGWQAISEDYEGLPIQHLGFIRPQLLRALLERSTALVFFSLYEGFGIPLLEAFDAGTPVICSNTTSLPEVGADAILSCDPTDIEAISDLMLRITEDPQLRQDLISKGKERLNDFTWEKAALNLFEAFIRVVSKNRKSSVDSPVFDSPSAFPLVSIVTPSYNQGKYLARTIESVLDQTYPNIEYLVIDGASTDESVAILKSYEGKLFWISEKDTGQTSAINKGLRLAKGDIVCYLNSDDILAPSAIQKVVDFFRRNPDCDLVYGDADYIDENDHVIGRYNTADYSFGRLMQDCMICQPATFWRRRVIDSVGLFDETLNCVMDYEYWLRFGRSGGAIRYISDNLAASRLYPETKTMSRRGEIYNEIFRVCRKHGGYVHMNYVQGYWHYLCYERSGIGSSLMRRVPVAYKVMPYLHHKWLNRKNYNSRLIARILYSKGKRFLMNWINRKSSTKMADLLDKIPSTGAKVFGFWHDNWLAPVFRIPVEATITQQERYIEGKAPVDVTLDVKAGEVLIGTFSLEKEQLHRVAFDSKLINGQDLTFIFSNYVVDGADRKLSFQLLDTNLFSERQVV